MPFRPSLNFYLMASLDVQASSKNLPRKAIQDKTPEVQVPLAQGTEVEDEESDECDEDEEEEEEEESSTSDEEPKTNKKTETQNKKKTEVQNKKKTEVLPLKDVKGNDDDEDDPVEILKALWASMTEEQQAAARKAMKTK
jgi:hypothetical protein